jgi:hypothetical protein
MLALISLYAPVVIIILAVVTVLFSFFWVSCRYRVGCRTLWDDCWFVSGAGASGGDSGSGSVGSEDSVQSFSEKQSFGFTLLVV